MKFVMGVLLSVFLVSCSKTEEISVGKFVFSVKDSIVFIYAGGELEDSMEYRETKGTGFIITDDGYIATAGHIFTQFLDAYPSIIMVAFSDSEESIAQLVFLSEKEDIAFLKVDKTLPRMSLVLEPTIPKYSDPVIVIGFYYDMLTFSTGAFYRYGLSKTEDPKNINYFGEFDPHMVYISYCFLAKGQSGGPMFNTSGKVIGLNISFSESNINGGKIFSIPASTIIKVFREATDIDILKEMR